MYCTSYVGVVNTLLSNLDKRISCIIRPGDSPAIIRLKKLAKIDSTELEQFQNELKAEKKR